MWKECRFQEGNTQAKLWAKNQENMKQKEKTKKQNKTKQKLQNMLNTQLKLNAHKS